METDKLPNFLFSLFILTENGIIGGKFRVEMSSQRVSWMFRAKRYVSKYPAGGFPGCFGKKGQSPFPNVGQIFDWISSKYIQAVLLPGDSLVPPVKGVTAAGGAVSGINDLTTKPRMSLFSVAAFTE